MVSSELAGVTGDPALWQDEDRMEGWVRRFIDEANGYDPPAAKQDWFEVAVASGFASYYCRDAERRSILKLIEAGERHDDYSEDVACVSACICDGPLDPALQVVERRDAMGSWAASKLSWHGLKTQNAWLIQRGVMRHRNCQKESTHCSPQWELVYSIQLKRVALGLEPLYYVVRATIENLDKNFARRAEIDMARLERYRRARRQLAEIS